MVNRIILIGLMGLSLIVCGCSNQNTKQVSFSNSQQLPTGTEISKNWKRYSDTKSKVSFYYPPDWISSPREHSILFEVGEKKYYLRFYQGSGIEVDSQINERRKYGGHFFLRTEYVRHKNIVLVTYSPIGFHIDATDGIELEVPDTNTDYYLRLFENIMSTIEISS